MLAIAAFSIFLLSNFFLKSYADFYFTVLEKKFISTTEGKRDPSIKVRFYEYQEITKKIEQSPIGGHGMGSSYSYFQPLANVTHTSTFTHNGYLNNIWRIGTPLFCFYLFFIIYYMIKAFYLAFIDKNNYFKPFLLIGGIALFDIVISSMVSDMFHQRESYFAISISIALISFSERELRKMNLLKYPPLRTIIYKRKT
jgi:O-antigen ligase